jgi:hypothetical protein
MTLPTRISFAAPRRVAALIQAKAHTVYICDASAPSWALVVAVAPQRTVSVR